ncbi:MAG: DNA-binding protein WhiA [Candidatus Izemoplasmatales bacterium]|jgi:DNA-binding protein WhiA
MSFSTDVKTELASLNHIDCCNRAELSAMYAIGGSIEISKESVSLQFQSTNLAVVRKLMKLTKTLFNIDMTLISQKQAKLQKHNMYHVKITTDVEKIITELALISPDGVFFQHLDPMIVKNDCCKKAYLRGVFLAGGSMNSPETPTYHLEIQTFSKELAEAIADLANHYKLKAKTAKNRRGQIVYLKEAERIADFLRVIDATNSLFVYEDSRIKRDFKNSINRVINCDIANEKKALAAAMRQLEQIEIIEKHFRNQIPKSMREAIFLRKKYPESTLLELSYASKEHFSEPISKSALNHRFRAMKDLAGKLMIEGERHD